MFNFLVQSKSCDDEVTKDHVHRKEAIEHVLLKTLRKREGLEIEDIISIQPRADLETNMLCGEDNNINNKYVIQMKVICTCPDFDNNGCDKCFDGFIDYKEFNNEFKIQLSLFEYEKGLLENIKRASLQKEKTQSS